MKWSIVIGVIFATCAAIRSVTLRNEPITSPRDIGTEVRAIFSAKCAGCHGSDLAQPEGRFGYVLDLKRIAANPELVIPGSPDESELWHLVKGDEMPPPDSPQGSLSPERKDVIRDWIRLGAPDVVSKPEIHSTDW